MIHKDAIVKAYARVEANAIVEAGATVEAGARVGAYATVKANATVGAYARVEAGAIVKAYAIVEANATVKANARVPTILGGYKYNANCYYDMKTQKHFIRLGCFSRTIEDWDADFNNNAQEFPPGSLQWKNRRAVYEFLKEWSLRNNQGGKQ